MPFLLQFFDDLEGSDSCVRNLEELSLYKASFYRTKAANYTVFIANPGDCNFKTRHFSLWPSPTFCKLFCFLFHPFAPILCFLPPKNPKIRIALKLLVRKTSPSLDQHLTSLQLPKASPATGWWLRKGFRSCRDMFRSWTNVRAASERQPWDSMSRGKTKRKYLSTGEPDFEKTINSTLDS